ncbi:MAG: hypothetical protein V3V13_10255 [Paracoccaceae bacterium]
MPLFRPEALETLRRWREPGIIAVLFAFAIWLLWRAIVQSSIISGLIGLVIAGAVGSLFYVAYLRARLRRSVSGPGIVEVLEREITYFAPDNGGSVDLDTVLRIQLSTRPSDTGDRHWILWHKGGSLVIPAAADGAGALIETFAALPDMSYDKILRGMESGTAEIFTIWER